MEVRRSTGKCFRQWGVPGRDQADCSGRAPGPPRSSVGSGTISAGGSGPPPGQEGVNQPLHSSPFPPWIWDALPNGGDGETEAAQGQEGPPPNPRGALGGLLAPLGGCQKPTMNEGLRAGGQDPHGGHNTGVHPPTSAASLPPIPSFPPQGAHPQTGGEGRQHPPSPNTPHCPTPPEHPHSHRHWGHRAGGCPEPAPRCQHPPLQPQTHHRPGWGGTGNQVLLVKLGAPVRAPPPSTAWGEDPGLLSPK